MSNRNVTYIGILSMLIVVAFIAVAAALGASSKLGVGQNKHVSINRVGMRAIVHGCPAEDTCSIDYKANGTWVIKHRRSGTY